MADTSLLRLHILGAPYFERGGQPVDLTAAKPIAVLTYLAVTRASHPREHILDLLWTDSAVESGRKNLRNALWTLRKTLGDEVLRTSGEYLTLSDNVWTDVQALERAAARPSSVSLSELQSAIDLYRGPLADGLVLDYAPEFELWLTAERERLANLYLQVLVTLVEARRMAGDWTGVIALARQGLKHHPWQESLYQALIEAHAQRGERSEALRQYEALRLVLDRELGIEPLPETQDLLEAVKQGVNVASSGPPYLGSGFRIPSDPEQGEVRVIRTRHPEGIFAAAHERETQNPEGRTRNAERGTRNPEGKGGVPFINRLAERAVLEAELEAASGGQARVVLLTGEMGIGKSRLWAEWSGQLGADVTLLETRCLATTQSVPLAPLAELFSGAAGGVGPEHAALVPAALAAPLDGPANRPAAQSSERLATFEAYVRHLLALETRPLVVFIDDMQWADDATLEWLGYMVHRLREQPLLLVGAYQPEGVPATLARLVAGWLRDGVARRLPLQRLSHAESSALIAACGCPPSMAERVLSLGMGNPYFLIELCKGVPDVSPAASTPLVPIPLAEFIRTRLDRLPQMAREVAKAASVLPPSFQFGALWQVSGRGEIEAVDALDSLLQAGVLREQDGSYAFAHPLVRVAVRDGLSGARRDLLSRRLVGASGTMQGPYPQETTGNNRNGNLALSYASTGGIFAQA